jgi:hypothetical protein
MQRKTPLRRTPLTRGSRLPSSTRPMKARKAGKPRRRAGACREYLDWLKDQACRITGKRTGEWINTLIVRSIGAFRIEVDPAHVRTKRLGGDLWNALSLSHHLHEELHQHGIKTFAAKYGCDLAELARQQTEEWLATAEGIAWQAEQAGETAPQ